jgi:hypothetical protein
MKSAGSAIPPYQISSPPLSPHVRISETMSITDDRADRIEADPQMVLPLDFREDDWFYRAVADERAGRIGMEDFDPTRNRQEDTDRFVHGNGIKGDVNGKFYQFGPEGIIVVRLWPGPVAWHKGPPDWKWRGFRPHLALVGHLIGMPIREPAPSFRKWAKPYSPRSAKAVRFHVGEHPNPAVRERCRQGFEAARRTQQRAKLAFSWVPREVARVVGRFRFRQWQILSMTARCPGALELLASNPGLGFALASANAFHPVHRPLDAMRRLVGKPRRHIAEWLGFPDTESAVRLLAKIPPEFCGIVPLFFLRKSLQSPGFLPRVRHLPSLPPMVTMLLRTRHLGPRVTDSFIFEVVEHAMGDDPVKLARHLTDCHFMALEPGDPLPARITSLDQLRRWHERKVEQINHRKNLELLSIRFPEPPLPGGCGIEPVLRPEELLAEGRDQHNCVGTYAQRIAEGDVFIYRVTEPERATLSIKRAGIGRWEVGELTAACNEPVTPATRRRIASWFAKSSDSRILTG